MIALLQALEKEYSPNNQGRSVGLELARRLAVAFHPAFQVAPTSQPTPQSGRPKGDRKIDHWELFRLIELSRFEAEKRGETFSVKQACANLSRQRRGLFHRQRPGSLETIYRNTGKQLADSISNNRYAPAQLAEFTGYIKTLLAKKKSQ